MFVDTLEENANTIKKAFDEKDIKFFTVKVHALKSTARIIGAMNLSNLAKELEDAGKTGNVQFIQNNSEKLLKEYRKFKEKLENLIEVEDDSDKELISDSELQEAYQAIKELAPQMDYDSIEMVLEQVHEYRLPKEEAVLVADIEKALRTFDWDRMEELLQDK